MMKTILQGGKVMAYSLPLEGGQIVYGTKHLKRSDLRDLFPQYQFCFMKQVHGRKVVRAAPRRLITADAHWTNETSQALVVQTADCLPILLKNRGRICAVHAGWRGVVNQVVPAALSIFSDLSCLEAGIGPHITQESFVVSKDTAVQLSMSSPQGKKSVFEAGGQKYRASLIDLVKSQIAHRISVKAWWNLPLNTFSSNLFYSFRRTAEKNMGQFSFIVLD